MMNPTGATAAMLTAVLMLSAGSVTAQDRSATIGVPAGGAVDATLGAGAEGAPDPAIVSADEGEAITVVAPRSLPAPVKRSPYTGAPEVTARLSIPVIYNDLDLSDPRDAQRLMTRVERVAQDACKELDRLYPTSPDADCYDRARANGRAAAEAAIRAARK